MGKKTQKNDFEISGMVIDASMPERITETFSKRIVVLEVFVKNYNIAKQVVFEFVNENMRNVDGVKKGDWVTINFQLKGNYKDDKEGRRRYFTSIEGLNILKHD